MCQSDTILGYALAIQSLPSCYYDQSHLELSKSETSCKSGEIIPMIPFRKLAIFCVIFVELLNKGMLEPNQCGWSLLFRSKVIPGK